MVHLAHLYMTTGKTIALSRWALVGKVICLLSNMLSRFAIVFLPRSKCLLISRLQSLSPVILEPKKNLSSYPLFPHLFAWSEGPECHGLRFWILSFKAAFSLSSFTFIKRLFSSSSLFAIRVVSTAYLRLLIFLLATLIPVWNSSSLAFCIISSSELLFSRCLFLNFRVIKHFAFVPL